LPDPLLTFLKYIFLALLYLFFLRVLRAVWIELREPKVVAADSDEASVFADAFVAAGAARHDGGSHDPGRRDPGSRHDPGTGSGATTTMTPVAGGSHLVVTSPAGSAGVTYPLTGEVTVGRSPGCSVSLPDDTFVSQVHARVFSRSGEWWVEDLGSTNGTFRNDERVHAAVVVRGGDRLQFGQTVLELRP
jgi:hypothetical protein